MRDGPKERLDPESKWLWRVQGALWSGSFALMAWMVTFILGQVASDAGASSDLSAWVGVPLWIAVVVLAVVLVGVVPDVRWRRWRYEIRETEVDLQRGIFYITRTLVPIARVQHVDTQQGPLERLFGLATVIFYTAAGPNRIPALATHVAAAARDRIAELTRAQDEL